MNFEQKSAYVKRNFLNKDKKSKDKLLKLNKANKATEIKAIKMIEYKLDHKFIHLTNFFAR